MSPDEKFVAASRPARFGNEIWITDLLRKTPLRVEFNQRNAIPPVWSPDGARLAFSCDEGLCEGNVPTGGTARILSRTRVWPQQYTADGRYVLAST